MKVPPAGISHIPFKDIAVQEDVRIGKDWNVIPFHPPRVVSGSEKPGVSATVNRMVSKGVPVASSQCPDTSPAGTMVRAVTEVAMPSTITKKVKRSMIPLQKHSRFSTGV